LFVSPTTHGLLVTKRLLQFFGDASGLITNLDKSEIFPIRCGDINLDVILGDHFKISQFPCVYLGLPLHYKKIPKHMIQLMVQRIGNKLLRWKRNLISYPGRGLLVKSVLTAIPTHFLTVHKLSAWARRDIVRNRILTLIEREDDTRSWGNFLIYFSHSTTMPCPPRGWGYILIGC
jgi:hypothetical protein